MKGGLQLKNACALCLALVAAVGLAASEDLISNGDMETLTNGRPTGWGSSGTVCEEDGNHFLRLVQTTPGATTLVYRRVNLPKSLTGYDQIDLSMRGRVSGLVKGVNSWNDARVMINVCSADGTKLSSPNISFGKDTDWSERHAYIKIVSGAAYLELMPSFLQSNAGTFDFDDFHMTLREPTEGLVAATTEGLGEADRLHVDGNRLVNAAGEHVWLQGVNVPSMEWGVKGEHMTDSFREAIDNWGARIIRLPLHSKYWFGTDASDGGIGYRQRVDNLLNEANGRGCYVLVDLHEYEKAKEDHAAFWRSCAARYANRPGVLFDLLNEPHDTTWEVWHDGLQMLLDAVRSTGAMNVVVCGGLDWGYDLSGVLTGYALTDTLGNGIMYSAHVYPWKGDWQHKFIDVAAVHPILLGEVGCQEEPMSFETEAKNPYEWAPKVLACIATNQLNWTAWCFHPKSSPCAISDWNYTPTPYWGAFVKETLRAAAGLNAEPGPEPEPEPEHPSEPGPEVDAYTVNVEAGETLKRLIGEVVTGEAKSIVKTGAGTWNAADTTAGNTFTDYPVIVKEGTLSTDFKGGSWNNLMIELDSSEHDVELQFPITENKSNGMKVTVLPGGDYTATIHRTGSSGKPNNLSVDFQKTAVICVDSSELIGTGSWKGDCGFTKTGTGDLEITGNQALDVGGPVIVQEGTIGFGESGAYATDPQTFIFGTSATPSTASLVLRFSNKLVMPANYSIKVNDCGESVEFRQYKSTKQNNGIACPIETDRLLTLNCNNSNSGYGNTYSGVISGKGGLSIKSTSGTYVQLSAVNTYTAGTKVSAGACWLNAESALGTGDVSVGAGATLVWKNPCNAIADTAKLTLDEGAVVDFGANDVTELVGKLVVGGITQSAGIYGAIGSGAQHEVAFVTGKGRLMVKGGTIVFVR